MSKVEVVNCVAFGDFSTDEVQTVLDSKETAVKFTVPLVSTSTSEGRVTVNHDCTEMRGNGRPPTSPEFHFTSQSSLLDNTHDYQFGSPASSKGVSTTSPSTLSTENSSSVSLNSSTSGRGSAKLNVFAKEFVPNPTPQNVSIISKNEMGVMGGAYPLPPIIPPPFIMSPYAHPIMFYPHTAAIPMGHPSSLRPNTGGPQVAVVAPYRAAHEPRQLLVVPDKYCTELEVEVEEELEEEEEEEDGINVTIDISQVKSLSLSPPPPSSPSVLTNQRSSSTNDIRTDHTHTTPTHVQTTPTTHTPDQSEIINKSNNNLPPSLPPSPPVSPSHRSARSNSPSPSLSPGQTTPTKITPTNNIDDNEKDDTIPINVTPATPPDSATEINKKEREVNTKIENSSSPPPLPSSKESSHEAESHDTTEDNTHNVDNKISNNLTKNDEILSFKDDNNSQPITMTTTPDVDNNSDNNNKIDDKLNKKSSSPSIRSWAAIVGKTTTVTTPNAPPTRTQVEVSSKGSTKPVGVVEGGAKEDRAKVEELKQERLKFIGSQIESISLNHTPASILPRGLLNSSNLCYIHAPLQALISCPELTHLLRSLSLPKMPPNDASSLATIVTENMVRFIGKFQTYPTRPQYDANGRRKNKVVVRDFSYEKPFRPDFIYEILPRIKSHLSVQGRQEDAEEFLSCFLNKFHEELVAARHTIATPTEVDTSSDGTKNGDGKKVEEEEGEWQEVGPKNKSTITRETDYMESPISQIFGGKVHTCLHRQGTKMSATVEPFFSLQLDIQFDSVKSIKDALDLMASKETINLSEKDGSGTRRTTLIHLPHVLILHLKRFIFDGTKSHKHINYDNELEIPKDLLAPSVKGKLTTSQRTYKLWAVVYHCGETPNGGHYICEAYHHQYGGWLRYDDNYVKPTNSEQLFRLAYKVPYLFFYRQTESSRS